MQYLEFLEAIVRMSYFLCQWEELEEIRRKQAAVMAMREDETEQPPNDASTPITSIDMFMPMPPAIAPPQSNTNSSIRERRKSNTSTINSRRPSIVSTLDNGGSLSDDSSIDIKISAKQVAEYVNKLAQQVLKKKI
jgi:hypothetical protein